RGPRPGVGHRAEGVTFLPQARSRGGGRGKTNVMRGLEAERIEGLRARGNEDALRLQVELERLETELAAEAGLLVAAERDTGKRRVGDVDPDGSGLDPARETMPPRRIPGPH